MEGRRWLRSKMEASQAWPTLLKATGRFLQGGDLKMKPISREKYVAPGSTWSPRVASGRKPEHWFGAVPTGRPRVGSSGRCSLPFKYTAEWFLRCNLSLRLWLVVQSVEGKAPLAGAGCFGKGEGQPAADGRSRRCSQASSSAPRAETSRNWF